MWDPLYRYPLLQILQALSVSLWLAYAILLSNTVLIVGNALVLGIIVVFTIGGYLYPRKVYILMLP